MQILSKEFFSMETEIVAKELIWKIIKVKNKYGVIIETEAYKHNCDEASHAYWKKTLRNQYMYDTFWFVYVYLIYWMYYCLNFTSDKTKPWAVLIRSVIGFDENNYTNYLERNENYEIEKILEKWTLITWPGRVTKFFGIDKTFNWLNLEKTEKIQVWDANIRIKNIKATPRIWISKAKDKLWRFIVDGLL